MTLSHISTGTVATATSSASDPITCSPAYPGSGAADDLAVLTVVSRHDTEATPTVTAGGGETWTSQGSASGGGGVFGAGTGPARITWFTSEMASGSPTAPTVNLAGTNTGRTLQAVLTIVRRDAGAWWNIGSAFGAEATAGTGWSQATTTDPGITSGDLLLIGYGVRDDQHAGFTAMGVTATSATIGAVSERADAVTGNGNDQGIALGTADVTAGTGTAAPVVTATIGSSESGEVGVLRIREGAGPQLVGAFETADWVTTTTPLTITVTGALDGDLIVVNYGGNNGTVGGATVTAATVSTTGGSTSGWTELDENLGTTSQAWLSNAWADVTADGTVTVSLARTQSTGRLWGGWAALLRHHGGVGVHGNSPPSATETESLTVAQDSAVVGLAIDWDALATVAFTPAGAVDVERAQAGAPNLTNYAGYWLAQAAGTRGYGIATSASTSIHINVVEVLAAVGDATATPAVIAATTAAPQVAAGVGAAPAVIARSFVTPQGAAGVGAAPAHIAAVSALPAAAVSVAAAPAVIPRAFTLPQAVAAESTTTTPAVISRAFTLPQASVSVGASPAVLAALVTLPAPAVSVGAAPAVIARAFTLPQATADPGAGNATSQPAVIAGVFALPQLAVSVGAVPAVTVLTVAMPQAVVGVAAAPAVIARAFVLPQVAVSVGAVPAVIARAFTLPQATVDSGGVSATATPGVIATVVVASQAAVSVGVLATVIARAFTLPQATAAISITALPAVIARAFVLPQVAVGVGASPTTITVVAAFPLPFLPGQLRVLIAVDTFTTAGTHDGGSVGGMVEASTSTAGQPA